MPSTSSHTFMKVNKSTFDGITASWAFEKWYSELAKVLRAAHKDKNEQRIKIKQPNDCHMHKTGQGRVGAIIQIE